MAMPSMPPFTVGTRGSLARKTPCTVAASSWKRGGGVCVFPGGLLNLLQTFGLCSRSAFFFSIPGCLLATQLFQREREKRNKNFSLDCLLRCFGICCPHGWHPSAEGTIWLGLCCVVYMCAHVFLLERVCTQIKSSRSEPGGGERDMVRN